MNTIEQILGGFFALLLASAQGVSWKVLSGRVDKLDNSKADINVCLEKHRWQEKQIEEILERLKRMEELQQKMALNIVKIMRNGVDKNG